MQITNHNHSARNLSFKKAIALTNSFKDLSTEDVKIATNAFLKAKPELDKISGDHNLYIMAFTFEPESPKLVLVAYPNEEGPEKEIITEDVPIHKFKELFFISFLGAPSVLRIS